MNGFGECPACGKWTLVKSKKQLDIPWEPMSGREFGNFLVFYVVCVNCGYEKEYNRIELESSSDPIVYAPDFDEDGAD
jgi:C4-type Zn-finger protein